MRLGIINSVIPVRPLFSFVVATASATAIATVVCGAAMSREVATLPVPAHGVIGVEAPQLTAEFWIARLTDPDKIVLNAAQIAARNDQLQHLDATLHDLHALPATLSRKQVLGWVEPARTATAL